MAQEPGPPGGAPGSGVWWWEERPCSSCSRSTVRSGSGARRSASDALTSQDEITEDVLSASGLTDILVSGLRQAASGSIPSTAASPCSPLGAQVRLVGAQGSCAHSRVEFSLQAMASTRAPTASAVLAFSGRPQWLPAHPTLAVTPHTGMARPLVARQPLPLALVWLQARRGPVSPGGGFPS